MRLAALLGGLFLVGCGHATAASSPTGDDAGAVDTDGGTTSTCAAGFAPFADGVGCDAIVPPSTCPDGTMPTLGSTACKPIGPSSCPAGFTLDAKKWVCNEVVPPAPCTGATIETLGSTACAPIDDCTAPFPPAAATVFVDASYTDEEIDATHVRTIAAGLGAVTAGATIAIESGTYAEVPNVTQAVNLVGRCAAQVVLMGGGAGAPYTTLTAKGVSIRGMTITNFAPGLIVELGGNVALEDVVFDANLDAAILVQGANTQATLTHSVVRGTIPSSVPAGLGISVQYGAHLAVTGVAVEGCAGDGISLTDPDTTLTLTNSIVRGTVASKTGGANGIEVTGGPSATITTSLVTDSAGNGVSVDTAKSSVKMSGSMVRSSTAGPGVGVFDGASFVADTSAIVSGLAVGLSAVGAGTTATLTNTTIASTAVSAGFGAGIGVQKGATVTFKSGVVVDSTYYGAAVFDANSSLEIDDSLVEDINADLSSGIGRGLDVQGGGHLIANRTSVLGAGSDAVVSDSTMGLANAELSGVLLLDPQGTGVFGREGGRVTMSASAILGATDVAFYESDTMGTVGTRVQATVTDSLFADTRANAMGMDGAGVVAGGIVALTNTTIARNATFGFAVSGAGASGSLVNVVVRDTKAQMADGMFGDGVIALDGSVFTMQGSQITGNASIGVAAESSSGIIASSTIANHPVGICVEGTSTLTQTANAPAATTPLQVFVTEDTLFLNDATKVSADELPLPVDPNVPSVTGAGY